MLEINMSEKAKEVAGATGDSWLSFMDTYGQIDEETIAEMDARGYDLIQTAHNNSHVDFKWELRS